MCRRSVACKAKGPPTQETTKAAYLHKGAPVQLSLQDRQAVEMGIESAVEDNVPVVEQVVRGDCCGYIRPGG